MAPFTAIFGCALLINIAATFRSSSYWNKYSHFFGYSNAETAESESSSEALLGNDAADADQTLKEKHTKLMKKYLPVYLLAVFSDWLQGPYVYALYDAYGYSQHEIAVLFVAGFGSSMVFGTFMGGFADAYGRKRFTLFFAIVYALSCLTKHFKNFSVLMLGRLLGGVATSLLFSVFDSWLIRSHAEAGVSSRLSKSFALAQYGNSIIAIVAGLLANKAADLTKLVPVYKGGDMLYQGGFLAPFDIAFGALCICGILAAMLWDENYGEENKSEETSKKNAHWYDSFVSALFTTIKSKEILFTGLICSLFEGSMYIFVFMWTPAIQSKTKDDIPFGLVFATFMVGCMAGSSIFSVLISKMKNEKIGVIAFSVATVTFMLMAFAPTDTLAMVAFLFFELTVGVYFPMMGTLKSTIVPESKRAAIYNIYRIPLNFIVLFSLLTDLTPKQSFSLCTCMLLTALLLMVKLMKHQQTFFSTSSNNDPEMGTKTASRSPSPLKQTTEITDVSESPSSNDGDKSE